MPVYLRYDFVCDQCKTGVEGPRLRVDMDPGFQLMRPRLPDGWLTFMELLLCEKHEVKYEITTND